MNILNLASKKRETYEINLTYSILWECALGIAAITNSALHDSLEKTEGEWLEIKESLPDELIKELDYVENNNTWKSLLQLLHLKHFEDINDFVICLQKLADEELKFYCLPYTGLRFQEIRKRAALNQEEAVNTLKEVTKANPFFPKYIEFISGVDAQHLRTHLIKVMKLWNEAFIKNDEKRSQQILQIDYENKKKAKGKMDPEEFLEWATGGIAYKPEPGVSKVLLIPQRIYRPWNIEADIEETKVFYYPVSNESITPKDRFTPDNFLTLKYKALGDEIRLRIVKLLYEENLSLQDITEKMEMGKSTIHHHLKILRSAKLVEIVESKYSLKKRGIQRLAEELESYLTK
ncbi:ArsR/SmtB family transcription factor [Jeotgalibacillus proteolyticus]|uniref:ArsR family transcriptional regulator n=1 Tax=Jeotgalibacillus proteolyticus TaxID=2082395 RepID=A0A2S5G9X6_9BACL|nr:metalloregulator ArsR/SmtB family transcription factor [Jeotgalibacillus proteolyticus]PPA69796.1 ArsR family transcriptional regulator [Jeotgalibacillus proteolyticus]